LWRIAWNILPVGMNLFKYVPSVSVFWDGVALFVKDPMNPSSISIYSWVVSLLSLLEKNNAIRKKKHETVRKISFK
jgi:hypothetical protein